MILHFSSSCFLFPFTNNHTFFSFPLVLYETQCQISSFCFLVCNLSLDLTIRHFNGSTLCFNKYHFTIFFIPFYAPSKFSELFNSFFSVLMFFHPLLLFIIFSNSINLGPNDQIIKGTLLSHEPIAYYFAFIFSILHFSYKSLFLKLILFTSYLFHHDRFYFTSFNIPFLLFSYFLSIFHFVLIDNKVVLKDYFHLFMLEINVKFRKVTKTLSWLF